MYLEQCHTLEKDLEFDKDSLGHESNGVWKKKKKKFTLKFLNCSLDPPPKKTQQQHVYDKPMPLKKSSKKPLERLASFVSQGVTVIVVGNGLDEPISNSRRSFLCIPLF